MPRPTSKDLHRAKRKKETDWRDEVLRIVGLGLEQALTTLARASIAARGNTAACERIRDAKCTIFSASTLLRIYYDDPSPD